MELEVLYNEYTYDMIKNIEPVVSNDDIFKLVKSFCYSLSINGVRDGYYFLVDNNNKSINTIFI